MMRLFIGLWPSAAVAEGVAAAQRELARLAPRGLLRLTPLEQVHLTLRFLGNVEEARVADLSAALAGAVAGCGPFALDSGGLGAFPSLERARVVWVGLGGELEALSALQKAASAACDRFAGKPEDKPFHPHLTLARVREAGPRERRQLGDAIERCAVLPSSSWTIETVRLMASELHPDGARYRVMTEIPLVAKR